jgi:hypothetical protein
MTLMLYLLAVSFPLEGVHLPAKKKLAHGCRLAELGGGAPPPSGRCRMNPIFERYIGIDYSGEQIPSSSLSGLRVYVAERMYAPQEVAPPPSPRKYWTRRGIAEWLVERLSEELPMLVGIDHGFSFPIQYFEQNGLLLNWPSFLDDFQQHWPTVETECACIRMNE